MKIGRAFSNFISNYFSPKKIQQRSSLKKQVQSLEKEVKAMENKPDFQSIKGRVTKGEELKEKITENLDTAKKDAPLLFRLETVIERFQKLEKENVPDESVGKILYYTGQKISPNADEALTITKELKKLTPDQIEEKADSLKDPLKEMIQHYNSPRKGEQEKTNNQQRLSNLLTLEKAVENIQPLYKELLPEFEKAKNNYLEKGISEKTTGDDHTSMTMIETLGETGGEPLALGQDFGLIQKELKTLKPNIIRQNSPMLADAVQGTLDRYLAAEVKTVELIPDSNEKKLKALNSLEEEVKKTPPLYARLRESFEAVKKKYSPEIKGEENTSYDPKTVFENIRDLTPNEVTGEFVTGPPVKDILAELKQLSPEEERANKNKIRRTLTTLIEQLGKKEKMGSKNLDQEMKKMKMEKMGMIRTYIGKLNEGGLFDEGEKQALEQRCDGVEKII